MNIAGVYYITAGQGRVVSINPETAQVEIKPISNSDLNQAWLFVPISTEGNLTVVLYNLGTGFILGLPTGKLLYLGTLDQLYLVSDNILIELSSGAFYSGNFVPFSAINPN